MPTWTDRRFDRSSVASEALDKLLSATARRHGLDGAVIADASGLLVATATDRSHGERLAGAVSLVERLREDLSAHEVLDGIAQARFRTHEGAGLAVWFFEFGTDEMILATLGGDDLPADDEARTIIEGVRRIFVSTAP